MKRYTVADAREWTQRAERAARHLKRRPDTRYRRFLESIITAAMGIARQARSYHEEERPRPRPGRCA